MIEIQWATEIGNESGDKILEGRYCHEDCDLFESLEGYCRAGYAIEDGTEYGKGFYVVPGPECPGPGCYKLVRIEEDDLEQLLGPK